MVVFPNCKINLGLRIIGKREDGFHDLETVFYPIALIDALEVLPSGNSEIEFTGSGLAVDGNTADNLCVKAWHLLKKDFPQLPAIRIHLHKAIPMGAGLGGGSADAACMLKLLNERFRLNIPTPQLMDYALQLGSDCPFFINNKPALATGRGELMEDIALDLSAYRIVLINPGIHINTGWAFTKIKPAAPAGTTRKIIEQPVESWKDELQNDFEAPVFEAHPQLKAIKDQLYAGGALYAAMSGSGSSLFGIFNTKTDIASFQNKNYFIKIIN